VCTLIAAPIPSPLEQGRCLPLAATVSRSGQLSAFVYVLDHAMAFDRLGVRAGNVGFRNPFVLLECSEQWWRFFAPARTVESLLGEANALFRVFNRIALSVASMDDLPKTRLAAILKAVKRSFGHGVVDVPVPIRFTERDEWSYPANLKALTLWQLAVGFCPTDDDLRHSVILNMRTIHPLQPDGRLSLGGLVMGGVAFSLLDEKNVAVAFDRDRLLSLEPVRPGSRLFFRLAVAVDTDRVVLCPPYLHCCIMLTGCVLQVLESTLVAGGSVFEHSTMGATKKQLKDMAAHVKQLILGRGYTVHSYTTLSGMTPIFSRWNDTLGAITHPAVSHLPLLTMTLLRTRSSNDLSLKSDPLRYSVSQISAARVTVCVIHLSVFAALPNVCRFCCYCPLWRARRAVETTKVQPFDGAVPSRPCGSRSGRCVFASH
jgi:hypothetical protein